MKSKIALLLPFLFISIFAVESQNADPHGDADSNITGMPAEKILMVLDITVADSIEYQKYREVLEPLIEKLGGTFLANSAEIAFDSEPNRKIIAGDVNWNPNQFILVQWKSVDELQRFSNSEEYKAIAKPRENSTTVQSVILKTFY